MDDHPSGPARLDDDDVRVLLGRLDDLLERVEQVPGPTTDAALEAIQLLTETYGEALARVLDVAGTGVVQRCARDELLRHLMVLHDLHPDSVEQRVEQVLAELRPHLPDDGQALELVGIESGVARVRLPPAGGCGSCSSVDSVEEALRDAVSALAPELAGVAPVHDDTSGGPQALIPVEALLRGPVSAGGPR